MLKKIAMHGTAIAAELSTGQLAIDKIETAPIANIAPLVMTLYLRTDHLLDNTLRIRFVK